VLFAIVHLAIEKNGELGIFGIKSNIAQKNVGKYQEVKIMFLQKILIINRIIECLRIL